ncbi:membrane protein [Lentzea pudingi]|uniref:Membrane protein n=1 Tax=Lentzea pudingi TaxID=1789439 RepID=A0ABQ2HBX8_9PSEU|nr:membrane protein [Lentzea pudingi]
MAGAAFLLVGVLGFIPGITTHYDELGLAGHSGALLFGLFAVSVLHNLVHLLFGVVGLLAAKKAQSARAFLMVGGGVYVVLWVYGSAIGEHTAANFLPVNTADNWLHLGLGAGMILLGVATTAVERARSDSPVN